MTSVRVTLRRILPFALRWRFRQVVRSLSDRAARVRFASGRSSADTFPCIVAAYERPLICYAGQESAFAGKLRNTELSLAATDGIVIAPGETFSMWRALGRPTERAGYRRAAALKAGVLTEDVGGALCLVSTLLYNAALLGGMEIVERRCHSVDSYGPARYFELGRDAAVEYAYVDLRFRNTLGVPLLLRAAIRGGAVHAELRARCALDLEVRVLVSEPHFLANTVRVRTERRVVYDGCERVDDLGWSTHRAPWLASRWVDC
jgi:hypothetical protein